MQEILSSFVLIIMVIFFVSYVTRNLSSLQRKIIALSGIGYAVSSVLMILMILEIYNGMGDMVSYIYKTKQFFMFVDFNFEAVKTVFALILKSTEVYVPFTIHGIGSATGSFTGITIIIAVFMGPSIWSVGFAFSMFAYLGQLMVFFGLSKHFKESFKIYVTLIAFFIPSVIFWSSGIIKETVALIGIGFMTLAFSNLFYIKIEKWLNILLFFIGGFLVWTVKPYLLVTFITAAGVAFYLKMKISNQPNFQIKLSQLIVMVILSIAIFVLIGVVAPEYSLASIQDESENLRLVGKRVTGGSSYVLPSNPIILIPYAIITGLFRPFIIEIHNPLALIASLETLIFLVLFLRGIVLHGVAKIITLVQRSPMLVFCVVFSITTALGVGLSTTNLGTLVRYRMPLVPFFMTFLLIINVKDPFSLILNVKEPFSQKKKFQITLNQSTVSSLKGNRPKRPWH